MNRNVYDQINQMLPENCQLLIVSKFRSKEQILDYYKIGHQAFAENRVQELCEKQQKLPKDIKWHFIGHLQKNKAKYIVPFIEMIHSVENLQLVQILEKEAAKCNRQLPILIQLNLAKEETKSGITKEEADSFIEACNQYPHILVKGIMCMGPHCDEPERIREVFHEAKLLLSTLQNKYPSMTECSMGMSQDYPIAIKEGSTMLRIGSALFNEE